MNTNICHENITARNTNMTGALLYHSLQVSLAKWIKHETFAYLSQKEFKPRKKQILIIFEA